MMALISYISEFLKEGISIDPSEIKNNFVNFVSREISIRKKVGAITVIFNRESGSLSTIDFEFQVSYGLTNIWSSAYYLRIRVRTNEDAVAEAVSKTLPVNFYGISHIRLSRIINNDNSNYIENCNAIVSY
jgi:hypothetical protein